MIRDDYLMRMLEEFINALIRLLLKRKRDQQTAAAELGDLASRYLGLDLSLLRTLSAEDIQQLFSSAGEPDYLKYYMAAELLRADSERTGERDMDQYRKAVRIYRLASPLIRGLESDDIRQRTAGLMDGLAVDRLAPDLAADLFRIQLAAGNTRAAVTMLHTLESRQSAEHTRELSAVYEDLQRGSDEELRSLGLSRKEISGRTARLAAD